MSITEKKRFGNNVRLPGANHFVHAYTYLPKHCLNFKACRSLLNWKNARSNVKKLMFSFPVYGSFSVRYFLTCCNNNRKVGERKTCFEERERAGKSLWLMIKKVTTSIVDVRAEVECFYCLVVYSMSIFYWYRRCIDGSESWP